MTFVTLRKLLTVGALLTVAACSSSGTSQESTGTASPADRYIQQIRADAKQIGPDSSLSDQPDDVLLSFGRTVCAWLKKPADHPYGPANDLLRSGVVDLASDAGAVVSAAKATLC